MTEELHGFNCPECQATEFFEMDGETVCLGCRTTISFNVYDGENSTPDNDSGNTCSTSLLPDISSKITIQGGNSRVKRMYSWNKVSYTEKQILRFYSIVSELYNIHQIKYAIMKTLGKLPEHTDLERLKNYAEMNGITYPPVNKKLIEKTINLYRILSLSDSGKKNFCQRQNNKIGIISAIFYYVNKEYNDIYTKKELSQIFGIDKKIVTDGYNHLNKVLKKNLKLREHINKRPITADDFIEKIHNKFPRMTADEIKLIKRYLSRIKNTVIALKGPPIILITGILMNLIKNYNVSFTETDLRNVYDHSSSTLNKYEKKLKPYLF